ncbi:MAG: hypothetical protein JMDDDDMK_02670 [Acidobacteria bacterium]|nr:hypothetical protein [Acidobacteriota bacterium]
MARATLSFPARKFPQSPGWIAPNGRFFPCPWYEHDSHADELARNYYPDEAKRKSGTQIFEEKRWVRLLDNGAFRVGPDLQAVPRITQAQRDTLFDLVTINSDNDFSRRLMMWLDQAEDS